MQKISIVMPIHNGETTIGKSLESLAAQEKDFFEVIIVNDASTDGSLEIINKFTSGKENWISINNSRNFGLAKSYNIGIRSAQGDLIVTMHQDIILMKDALEKLIVPFEDKEVVAAGHADIHPKELWNKYNFWQKCFFARFQKLNISGVNGQFDCFRKSALEKVGLFDEVHFRTAGEDGDMVARLKKIGKVAGSSAKTIHLHKIDPNFSWRGIILKQAQYSEAQGALLALGRTKGAGNIARAFFREILIFLLLVPYINMLSLMLIAIYAFKYTGRVYLEEYKNPRIILLPFLNIYLLFVSIIYCAKGFIYGKQKI